MDTSELQKIKQRYNVVGNSDGLNRALDIALLTSLLKKHTFYNLLINNILYLCVT